MHVAFLFLLCALLGASANTEPSHPHVTTSTGALVGQTVKVFDADVQAFLGVPYAEPPLGDLRFRPPIPAQSWSGLKPAQQKPKPCPQPRHDHLWSPTTEPSEDCLYLNIWAPEHHDSALPVMVWFHGGGFIMGSTDMDIYDGSALASHGEVVVVTVNYRLGAFGFLYTGTEEAPGNVGMLDQVLALAWVRENIANFGGDPYKVTIFGESAGSWSVSLHLASPLSKGLFRRAIMQSGSMYHPMVAHSQEIAKQSAAKFANLAGCGEHDVECLRKLDFGELIRVQASMSTLASGTFLPCFGDDFLPRHPSEIYESDEWSSDADVMMGVTKDEGTLILAFMFPDVFPLDRVPDVSFEKAEGTLRAFFGIYPKHVVDSVVEYYLQNASSSEDLIQACSDALADAYFNCPSVYLAEKVDSHVYWFTHRPDKAHFADWMGAHHFCEVPYVFGGPVVDPDRHGPQDGEFSKDVMRMWADFAHHGHPLKDNTEGWPKFSRAEPLARELHPRSPGLIRFPRFDACDRLWRHLYTPRVQQDRTKTEL